MEELLKEEQGLTSRLVNGPFYTLLDNQKEKSLVFVEGFCGMKGLSNCMLQYLKTRNAYSYETINHYDKTRWQDDMSHEAMAQDLLKFVDSQGLKTFTLAGGCVGARIAMKFAGMYPDRVDGIIVIEGSVKEFELPYVHEIVQCMFEIEGKPLEKFDEYLEEYFPGKEGKYKEEINNEDIRRWIHFLRERQNNETIEFRYNFAAIKANYKKNICYLEPDFKYEGKVLIIQGGKSHYQVNFEDFHPVFPNLDLQRDVLVNPEHNHTAIKVHAPFIASQIDQFISSMIDV